MPKQSLYQLVKTIAKKGKIQITPPKKSAAVPAAGGVIRVAAPLARPCGSDTRGQKNRYSKSELVALAKASGVDSKQDMDSLCAALGISPHQAEVDLPAKQCNTMARGDDRYTRDDVKRLAMARGIKISGKTMTDLCNEVGISRAQVLPRGSSSSPVRAGKKPSISPARSPRVRPPVLSRSVSSDSSSSSRSFSSGPSFSSSPSFSSGPSSYSPVPKQPSPALIRKQAQFFNEPSLWGNPPQDVSGGLFSQRRSIPSEAVQVFPRPRMGSMSGEEASVSSTSDVSDRIPASASSVGDVFDQIPVPSRKKRTGLTSEQRQSLVDELVSIKPQAARRSARLQNKM